MEVLSEDILQQMRSAHPGIDNEMNEETANLALCEIEDEVMNLAQKQLQDFGMPTPTTESRSVNI